MDIHKIQDADYLDILFDERNKNYGSYQLRKKYAARTLLAGAISICFISGAFALTLLPKNKSKIEPPTTYKPNIINVTHPPKIQQPQNQKQPKEVIAKSNKQLEKLNTKPSNGTPAQKKGPTDLTESAKYKNTQHVTVLNVKDNNLVNADNVIKQLKNDAENGIADLKGDKDGFTRGMDLSASGTEGRGKLVGGTGRKPGTDLKYNPRQASWSVAKTAVPGYDMLAWLNRNITYTPEAQREGLNGKIIVRIVVGIDGSVSDVTIMGRRLGGGLDESTINVIKNKLPKFKSPGYDANGNAVASYYRIPVSFNIVN